MTGVPKTSDLLSGVSRIGGGTKVCAVIGDPIEHSLSPAIHNEAYRSLDMDFVYVAFRVRRGELKRAIEGVRALGIVGLNVTRPHKTSVMRLLDTIERTTREIGAVNTIVRSGSELRGHNTDGQAALEVLRKLSGGLSDARVAILGAGGAARAIAYYLSKTTQSISILNRTRGKGSKLAREITRWSGVKCISCGLDGASLRKEVGQCDVLINTLPVDVVPRFASGLIREGLIRRGMIVFDANYIQTSNFLAEAESAGAKVVDGLDMLVGQAALSHKLWTGQDPPIDVMQKAALQARQVRAK